MIYLILFFEFFKIGLFAIGGGLVTVPFLFDLADKYHWFSAGELADMIAISESTPGPLGINMATYAGYQTAGIGGVLAATFGLVLPSLVIIIWVAKMLNKYARNERLHTVLDGLRPAVIALILFAGLEITRLAVTNALDLALLAGLFGLIHFYKKSPIFYLLLSAALGIVLKL